MCFVTMNLDQSEPYDQLVDGRSGHRYGNHNQKRNVFTIMRLEKRTKNHEVEGEDTSPWMSELSWSRMEGVPSEDES